MSEKAQIGIALGVMLVALLVVVLTATGSADPPAAAPAPIAQPTPDRQAARAAFEEAQRADQADHDARRAEFVRAREATDWPAALAATERGVERFPDPSRELGGYWLKQRNHLSRLIGAR